MQNVLVAWVVALLPLLATAAILGRIVKHGWTGILIDHRGRYSLTHFQVVLWTLVVLSLIVGLFMARLFAGVPDPLGFAIPDELLLVMGITLGGGAISTAIKSGKDAAHPHKVAASSEGDPPRFSQMFLLEEGELADKVVDVAKFQNFWLTLILVAAYVVMAVAAIRQAGSAGAVVLPGFDDRLLVLLATSHAGYLAGKLPTPAGVPEGLSVDLRTRHARPAAAPAVAAPAAGPTYVPRNPKP